jgi:hypothetical protein
MKTVNANAKGIKQNTQLRRKAMKSARLIAIVFSTAAFAASGCSRDGQPVGPSSDLSVDVGRNEGPEVILTEGDANSPGMLAASHEEDNKRFSLEVTLQKSEVEGGCWYLETAEGTIYEPCFGEDSPVLSVGKKLLVAGYIDMNIVTYCMIGPVFMVEKYREISTESINRRWQPAEIRGSGSAALAAGGSRSAEDGEWAGDNWITLEGYFGSNDEGCQYIYNEKGIFAELDFGQGICPNIRNGASIVVAGSYSLLGWSPCQMAPLFNVEKYEVIRSRAKTDVYSNEL